MTWCRRFWMVAALVAIAMGGGASGSERRFTYTYDSSVLNPGDRELEPWTTVRMGKADYFVQYDERLELEMGLVDRLQAALYLNFSGRAEGTGANFTSQTELGGVSCELKYKVLDPVADPMGFALYLELGGGPTETELEGKLIFDKRFGAIHTALNIVGEYEWEFSTAGLTRELLLEVDLGAAWVTSWGLSVGLELRNHNERVAGYGWEHSTFFLGPTVSYADKNWWAALSMLPQLGAIHGATSGNMVLDEHENLETRLIVGWHL